MSVLVDANILIYAKFSDFPQHAACRSWLDAILNQPEPVGMPWQSLMAFMRISTNRRIFDQPLSPKQSLAQLGEWLSRGNVWQPEPGDRFTEMFRKLATEAQATGNLVSDAYLAALACEHGLTVVSTDADFARFKGVKWYDPAS